MIPKTIHYCWFGGNPLPELALKCIESWRKYLPDYEIKEWNESNFDVNAIPYTAEAYAMKKYAFVSDYARFKILYKHGGLYFDTDVEIIKPLDDIIERGAFMGMESNGHGDVLPTVAPGLGIGAPAGINIIDKLIKHYDNAHFEFKHGVIGQETVVHITTRFLLTQGLHTSNGIQHVGDVWIYPSEYFCPINLTTNRLHITPNTRSIHHYAGTWIDRKFSWKRWIKAKLPEQLLLILSNMRSSKS